MAEKSVQGSNAVSPRDMNSNRTSLVAQTVKRLSTVWETRVRALGRDFLEQGSNASALEAWNLNPWTTSEVSKIHIFLSIFAVGYCMALPSPPPHPHPYHKWLSSLSEGTHQE